MRALLWLDPYPTSPHICNPTVYLFTFISRLPCDSTLTP